VLAPTIIGTGIEAVGPLGVDRVADGIRLVNRSVFLAGEDVLMAFDVANAAHVPEELTEASARRG
jgi:hypothetical protein